MKSSNPVLVISGFIRTLSAVATAIFLIANPLYAAETVIYKSIAEDGSVVFTDEPSDGAKSFKPTELNVVTPPETKRKPSRTNSNKAEEALKALTVRYVKILSPTSDQTFINPVGSIPIRISTGHEGKLPLGHTAQILVNGAVATSGNAISFSVPVPHRGAHTVSARVFDAAGKLRARSRTVKINIIKPVVGGGN